MGTKISRNYSGKKEGFCCYFFIFPGFSDHKSLLINLQRLKIISKIDVNISYISQVFTDTSFIIY